MKFFASLALFVSSALAYPTAEERESVKFWDDLAVQFSFDYEMHTAVTDDEWELTLFRIIGRVGEEKKASTKPPVLIQNGNTQDAALWMAQTQLVSQENDPWMLKLVDRGYDVWMGNNRGTRYSLENNKFPDAENKDSPNYAEQNAAKYDWSWFEMGIYDQPANVKKILEVTEAEKVTYIGYSQGSTQMLVGLSQLEESFFADRLNKAIFLAPCMITPSSGINFYRQMFPIYKERGINAAMGEGSYQDDIASLCNDLPESPACLYAFTDPTFQGNSRKSFEYYAQVADTGRFQEYNPGYATADSLISPLITPGIDSIDKVPVQFVMAASDTTCPIAFAQRFHDEIKSMAGYTFLDDVTFDHLIFVVINTPEWVDLLVEQIEMEAVFEEKSTSKDCIPQGGASENSEDDSAQMVNLAFGGAVTLFVSAVSLF